MIDKSNPYKSDLHKTFLGEVMEVEDPLFKGRIKVKVFGKFDDIPVEDMPWSHPGMNSTGGSVTGGGFFSVPKVGSIVSIKFDQGNIYHPEYFCNQEISDEVKLALKSLLWDKVDSKSMVDAEEFKILLPDSNLFWIDKCGHAAMMEQPKEFNKILHQWLIERGF